MSGGPRTWRPLTPHDAAAIVRLDHATLQVDDRDDPLSLEEVEEEFEPSWACPEERSVAAVPDGVAVARWAERWSEPTRLAHVDAFADHWGSTPPDEEAWQHGFVGAASFRPELSLVAHGDGEVVGYLLADVWEQDWELKGHREAWVGTLGTRRSWRGRGVASALLLDSMHRMRTAGMEYAAIGVDSESPTGADRLYAQLGFELQRVGITYALPVTALR